MKLTSLLLSASFGAALSASAIQIDLNHEFSGASAPTGPSPWASAIIQNDGAGVLLTMRINAGNDITKLTSWSFNLNPAMNPANISYSAVDVSDVGSLGFSTGVDAFKMDGDGFYDLLFTFPTGGNRFVSGEEVVVRLTSSAGALTESDFLFYDNGGSKGDWMSAAHVQGLGNNNQDSGWIAGTLSTSVPEGGATIALLGLALTGLGVLRNRKS